MDLVQQLIIRAGREDAPRSTKAGKLFSQEGVSEGPELLRVRSLPRRRWQDDPNLDELVAHQTARFKRDKPEDPDAVLFPVQAVVLAEYELYGFVTVVVSVGGGKTLLSALLPTLADAKRPLLLQPANLVDKTRRELKKLSKTWRVHPGITILSYEKVSSKAYKTFLQDGRFDFVFADESYYMKTPDKARAVRVGDYVLEHGVPFVPATGTPGDSTIGDYAHYFWFSGRDNVPLPKPGTWELAQWTQATDEKTSEIRRAPGALLQFAVGSADTQLDRVREGIGRRIEETPGFVYHREASVNCSLQIDALVHDDYSQKVDELFEYVRESGDELPDGRVLDSPLEVWNALATFELGFYRVIDPSPPAEWRAARKAHRKFVNEVLKDRSFGFETAGEVEDELRAGTLDSCGVFEAWTEIEPTFAPVSHTEWFSDEVVQMLAEWMQHNHALVWTLYPAFGRALARASKRPFFHRQGVSLTHGSIEAYEQSDSVVLSTKSNYMGRNLQDRWHKNLIVGVPGKADTQEQLIGRTHRTGQKADAVEVSYFLGSIESAESVDRARSRAEIDKRLGRNKSSKLLCCDWLVPDVSHLVSTRRNARWCKA